MAVRLQKWQCLSRGAKRDLQFELSCRHSLNPHHSSSPQNKINRSAGLTPKFRDTAVLCDSLTYATGPPDVLKGERVHDHVKVGLGGGCVCACVCGG